MAERFCEWNTLYWDKSCTVTFTTYVHDTSNVVSVRFSTNFARAYGTRRLRVRKKYYIAKRINIILYPIFS